MMYSRISFYKKDLMYVNFWKKINFLAKIILPYILTNDRNLSRCVNKRDRTLLYVHVHVCMYVINYTCAIVTTEI